MSRPEGRGGRATLYSFGPDLLGETHDQQNREFVIRAEVQAPADILRSATRVNAVEGAAPSAPCLRTSHA